MNVKTVCPRDCPGRYPGCGAKCEKFKQHRAESQKRYERNVNQIKIGTVLYDGWRRTARK